MTRLVLVLAVLIACGSAMPTAARQRADDTPVDVLLSRVHGYLAEFAKAYAQAVAEERYLQNLRPKRVNLGLTTTQRREIKADVVAVSDDSQTWLNFRDVFAVDGIGVRDRDERLTKLFLSESGDPLAKARVIADEGARFNLGSVSRNVNFPAMALTFLASTNQARSVFRLDGHGRMAGVDTTIIAFQETQHPTIVKSTDVDLPVSGRFWIEPATGRVMKSRIRFESRDFSGQIDVTYGYVEKLKLWLPVEMVDSCEGPSEVVSSRATYSNFRRFGTSAVIK
ncbi:MAG: hypothetical protein WCQ64_10630 [Acidobacteriota bacterium]